MLSTFEYLNITIHTKQSVTDNCKLIYMCTIISWTFYIWCFCIDMSNNYKSYWCIVLSKLTIRFNFLL